MSENPNIPVHPVQNAPAHRDGSVMPQVVTMRAYEVYCEVFKPQEAMVTGGCRGGFCLGEIAAFLYARSFPRGEWRMRVKEALEGMRL